MTAIDRLGRPLRSTPFRANCYVATTGNITLYGEQTIDTKTVSAGYRVLVWQQTNAAENGIYIASGGAWERPRDLSTSEDFKGPVFVTVEDGLSNRNRLFGYYPYGSVTVGSTPIIFEAIKFQPSSQPAQAFEESVVPRTVWIELDALCLPGVLTRETQSGVIAFNSTYMKEKLTALHSIGMRDFLFITISDNGRTYTRWGIDTPKDYLGNTFGWWRDDVADAFKANVEDFDVVESAVRHVATLSGSRSIIGFGRHDDLNLLNDMAATPAAPAVVARRDAEIARYTAEINHFQDRFPDLPWGVYCSHEADKIQETGALYGPIADVVRGLGREFHVSTASPIDLADSDTIADALLTWKAHVVWVQTSAGYGYNFSTGRDTYTPGVTINGVPGHMALWESLRTRCRTRPSKVYTPEIGADIEGWRIGVPGVGTLTFAALSGTDVTVTLGTASSVVASDIGKTINVLAGQATGLATVKSIINATSIKVDITEALANVNVIAGFWSIVPVTTDSISDAYPANHSEILLELEYVSPYVSRVSIYGEAFLDPGNLSLRIRQSQPSSTTYQDLARNQWVNYRKIAEDTVATSRFLSLAMQEIGDPSADRILFWDDSAGGGNQGRFQWLQLSPELGITGNTLAVSGGSTAFSPTVAALSGSITTLGAVVARYRRMGKMISFQIVVNITTNGTGAGAITVTMPTGAAYDAACSGAETAISNASLRAEIAEGSSTLAIRKYDGTYPGANGARLVVSGTYEEV